MKSEPATTGQLSSSVAFPIDPGPTTMHLLVV
jgi:hypothetical protein